MYQGYSEDDKTALYEINGNETFFKEAVISVSYSVENTLCLHIEEFSWSKLLESCKECK